VSQTCQNLGLVFHADLPRESADRLLPSVRAAPAAAGRKGVKRPPVRAQRAARPRSKRLLARRLRSNATWGQSRPTAEEINAAR